MTKSRGLWTFFLYWVMSWWVTHSLVLWYCVLCWCVFSGKISRHIFKKSRQSVMWHTFSYCKEPCRVTVHDQQLLQVHTHTQWWLSLLLHVCFMLFIVCNVLCFLAALVWLMFVSYCHEVLHVYLIFASWLIDCCMFWSFSEGTLIKYYYREHKCNVVLLFCDWHIPGHMRWITWTSGSIKGGTFWVCE